MTISDSRAPQRWRKTTQTLAPARRDKTPDGDQYELYPSFDIGPDKIHIGWDALAARLGESQSVIIDGYGGVFWDNVRQSLETALDARGIAVNWLDMRDVFREADEIEERLMPFLGDDVLFGRRFPGDLREFFVWERLGSVTRPLTSGITIVYGCGAALVDWDAALLVYIDTPKNEIQFRARAGSICNLGARQPGDAKSMYKRFYFVDWPALNRHKADLLPKLDLIVDEQRPDEPTFTTGDDLRTALAAMSRSALRVRPWFEPGPWGGQWIKRQIPELPQDVPNYAWSFELIVPENGLILESDGLLLEVSFDFLMFQEYQAVLGDHAARFGMEFPIRFDFLDTVEGGNLSVQCHPRPEYIRRHFGETFTQDETYYILDAGPSAVVYLGFQEGVDRTVFRTALETSHRDSVPMDIEAFVQKLPAAKHDLFLIPNGTVHCSGTENLVLEISATPYIFTFKMYDWLRLDLDGNPRPLNIARAFDNLDFARQGTVVQETLVSKPLVIASGPNWRLVHLPTHPDHFYDVHRFEFSDGVEATLDGSPHVLSLVEGAAVILETNDGHRRRIHYAETVVIPAASGRYRLLSEQGQPVKVIKAFLKKVGL